MITRLKEVFNISDMIQKFEDRLKAKDDKITKQKDEILILKLEIDKLKQELFGKRTERMKSRQEQTAELLFNEVELIGELPHKETADKTGIVKSHTRRKPGRKPLPAELERIEIIHDLNPAEKVCSCGTSLKKISEDSAEKLRVIPMQLKVERHIYPKYVCPECSGKSREAISPDAPAEVIQAVREPSLIPKSILTPSLLATVIVSKFRDSLPLYRQAKIFKRFKLDISRAAMAGWIIAVFLRYRRIRKLLYDELRNSSVINMDETVFQVLKVPDRAAGKQARLWAFRSANENGTTVLFEYRRTRSGKYLPKRFKNYTGTIVCDGFDAYNSLVRKMSSVRAGCWAHVRRKFFKAFQMDNSNQTAKLFIDKIGLLYSIEEQCRDLSPERTKKFRQKYSLAVIDEIGKMADDYVMKVPPGTDLGKALNYMRNEWDYLKVFLRDGEVPIDNNRIENDIRPFAVGRKNWLFADTEKGAAASAFFYSLVQTASANGHEPYWYLIYLFSRLPLAGRNKEALKALLPMYVSPAQVQDFCKVNGYN